MDSSADSASNSLGLDLDALKIKDDPESSGSPEAAADDASTALSAEDASASKSAEGVDEAPPDEEARSPVSEGKRSEAKEKKKPYVNVDRFKTGGQRDKPSDEELAERMTRIREQNEKIKQRRIDVQADEEAFKKTQQVERMKAARNKKVQENIDRTREQNARNKMEKMQSREWDSGKSNREWKPAKNAEQSDDASKGPRQSIGIRGAVRGGGRGRGRGRTPSATAPESSEKTAVAETIPAPAAAT
ncbi:uncharacterized protein FIBRA_02179 [Fibroporia radiculosa]|uniref:Uncharacterized protein n=1 Tax=Fibroporia radiculosa TaxID=599839 RepID=J4HUH5_9APHY|nr:uncharacterized protein FIBRA_02179 [Fibroporia radiculosa]CCM00152.1 predicted protein [Fibroporia radiculosa]